MTDLLYDIVNFNFKWTLKKAYKNSTDTELVQKTIQAVPKDLLQRVLHKLKPDYDIFNYKFDAF